MIWFIRILPVVAATTSSMQSPRTRRCSFLIVTTLSQERASLCSDWSVSASDGQLTSKHAPTGESTI